MEEDIMPCTFTTFRLREQQAEKQREQDRQAEEARKKREIEEKKKALFAAMAAIGFVVETETQLEDGKEFIVAVERK